MQTDIFEDVSMGPDGLRQTPMCPDGCQKQVDSSEDVLMGPDDLQQTPNVAEES